MEKIEKKLILTIDDDHDTRALFKMVLEENNFNVIEAANGTRGIEIFEAESPDLVLLDLRMPGITGFDVLHHITKISPTTPVIVISATDSIDDVVESLRFGAWDFILKPMQTYNIMLHRVNQVLEKSNLKKQNLEYQGLLEDAINKLQNDLKSGQDIQIKLLPDSTVTFNGYQFNSLILPSLYLSGDFLDYFAINDKYTAFYIADVSGHGVSSALVTVFLKSFMNKCIDDYKQSNNQTVLDPGKLLQTLNQDFLNEHLDKFSTLFFGLIDHNDNKLIYCNGGHYPFPVLRQNEKCIILESKNTPIGIMPDIAFENISVQLEENFFLAFFSDGILDILPQDSLDEKINLLNELCMSDRETFQNFISGLKDNSAGLPDDITVLTIEKG
ncbi:MAG: fused response regulator/phosphatase [Calditrichaeota bacterium]|nr:MAG: fused response regulator/phosphatase [Calditrichota bacterium]MBL1205341.1 fused response regulator/phosphatase [Calditrichota bacterium]NOG45170.1 fused response regulator/phosphatase [Calditrichota bacterium]